MLDFKVYKAKLGRRIVFFSPIKNNTLHGVSLWMNFNKPYGSLWSQNNDEDFICTYFGLFKYTYLKNDIYYKTYGFTCFVFGIHFITCKKLS